MTDMEKVFEKQITDKRLLCIHSRLIRHAYYMPGTILDTGNTGMKKDKTTALLVLTF